MTYQELLEAAAKAAELDTPRFVRDGFSLGWELPFGISTESGEHAHRLWNPLLDDGDAFRLAVQLGFSVDTVGLNEHDRPAACVIFYGVEGFKQVLERIKNDPYAATRRAIVRAAASIRENQNAPT